MDGTLRQITQLPSDPGPAAWAELLPPIPQRRPIDKDREVDWAVIGAGFTGLSAAKRLAELNPTDSVLVLEATGIASGPAGRNSGFMIDLPHVLTSSNYSQDEKYTSGDIAVNRAGIQYALEAKHAFNMCDETILLSGKINGAVTRKGHLHNEDYIHYLTSIGEPFDLFDQNKMRNITGCEAYVSGVYTPGTAMLQPAMYIRALARGIESLGVSLHEQSPVIKLERNNQGWVLRTPESTVTAQRVILAVNGHVESFGYSSRELMHVYTYGSMSEALSKDQIKRLGGASSWAITPADPLGTTVRRISGTGGDRLIIRNRATFNPSLHVDESKLNAIGKTHDQSFNDRFPMLSDVRMAYRWGGRLCLSRNDVPVFGEIERGLFAACCQNGLGTAKGTASGKLIAELACNQNSELLSVLQNLPKPQRLPPNPMAAIGATAYIRYGEWRAGKEL